MIFFLTTQLMCKRRACFGTPSGTESTLKQNEKMTVTRVQVTFSAQVGVLFHLRRLSFWGDRKERRRGGKTAPGSSSVLVLTRRPASKRSWNKQTKIFFALSQQQAQRIPSTTTKIKRVNLWPQMSGVLTVFARGSSERTAWRCRTSSWRNGPERGLGWETHTDDQTINVTLLQNSIFYY